MLIEAAKGGHADIVKLLFSWLNSHSQLPITEDHFYEEEEEDDDDGGDDEDDDDDDDDLDDDDNVQPLQLTTLQNDHSDPLIPYIDSNSDKSQHSQAPAHSHHQLSSIIFSDNSDNDDDEDDDDDEVDEDEDDEEEDDTVDGADNDNDNSSLKAAKALRSSTESSSFASSRIEWKTDQIERDPELQKLLRLHVRKDKARTLSCGSDSILPTSRWRNVVNSSHLMVEKEGASKVLRSPARKACSSDVHYCSDKTCSMCGCMKAVKQMEVEKKRVGRKRGDEHVLRLPRAVFKAST